MSYSVTLIQSAISRVSLLGQVVVSEGLSVRLFHRQVLGRVVESGEALGR